MKTLGQIAYEASAALTGCAQPWDAATQAKWEAAALAVAEECAKTCNEKHANGNWKYDTRDECAEAIRMRSNGGGQHDD